MDPKSSCSSLNEFMGTPMHHLESISDEKSKHALNKRCGIRKMWFAAFASLLLCFTKGLAKGYSAPATYDMRHTTSCVIKPTEKDVMWIGSIMALGIVVGSLISGKHFFYPKTL